MKISRREFLKKTGVVTGSFILPGNIKKKGKIQNGFSKVIIAKSERLLRNGNILDSAAAKEYVNRGLSILTGKRKYREAWRTVFSENEKVGIKLSCLPGRSLSSSKGLVEAVVKGLILAGIRSDNIIIWERSDRELEKAGFSISGRGIKVFGTDNKIAGGYSGNIEFSGSVGTCFSKIMYTVDSIINIPVLKDHDLAGVSCGMKNFYGAIFNPNKFHSNGCDPYISDLNKHSLIKNKLKLVVCDASRIQVHNGPAYYPKYSIEYGAILIGADPVAVDFTGWRIIESERKRLGLKSLKCEGREPKYIKTAGDHGLGNGDSSSVKIIRI